MRLQTPVFKNKKMAVAWMLFLAAALVAVDYFLAPVQTDSNWSFRRIETQSNIFSCSSLIDQYSGLNCLHQHSQIENSGLRIKSDDYKGSISTVTTTDTEKNKRYE